MTMLYNGYGNKSNISNKVKPSSLDNRSNINSNANANASNSCKKSPNLNANPNHNTYTSSQGAEKKRQFTDILRQYANRVPYTSNLISPMFQKKKANLNKRNTSGSGSRNKLSFISQSSKGRSNSKDSRTIEVTEQMDQKSLSRLIEKNYQKTIDKIEKENNLSSLTNLAVLNSRKDKTSPSMRSPFSQKTIF